MDWLVLVGVTAVVGAVIIAAALRWAAEPNRRALQQTLVEPLPITPEQREKEKKVLLLQLSSQDNQTAIEAALKLRERGQHADGTLQNIQLENAQLKRANLEEANLQGANLTSANLTGANLGRADLRRVIFLDARLMGANLAGANLERANLRGANLLEANMTGAILDKAEFDEATTLPSGKMWQPDTKKDSSATTKKRATKP